MRTWMVGACVALATVVALVVVGASAATAPAAAGAKFETTLTATLTERGGGGCCFVYNYFSGTGTFPRIGRAEFSGVTFSGTYAGESVEYVHEFTLSVVAANGRAVTFGSEQRWTPSEQIPPPLWTASGSGYSGSGLYTITPSVFDQFVDPGTELTIMLSGTLQREH